MSSHTINRRLPIFFPAPEERNRKESKNERKRLGIEILSSNPSKPYFISKILSLGMSCLDQIKFEFI
jgi:hypothetical protein